MLEAFNAYLHGFTPPTPRSLQTPARWWIGSTQLVNPDRTTHR
jgi:hypothetical protein